MAISNLNINLNKNVIKLSLWERIKMLFHSTIVINVKYDMDYTKMIANNKFKRLRRIL